MCKILSFSSPERRAIPRPPEAKAASAEPSNAAPGFLIHPGFSVAAQGPTQEGPTCTGTCFHASTGCQCLLDFQEVLWWWRLKVHVLEAVWMHEAATHQAQQGHIALAHSTVLSDAIEKHRVSRTQGRASETVCITATLCPSDAAPRNTQLTQEWLHAGMAAILGGGNLSSSDGHQPVLLGQCVQAARCSFPRMSCPPRLGGLDASHAHESAYQQGKMKEYWSCDLELSQDNSPRRHVFHSFCAVQYCTVLSTVLYRAALY